LFTASSPSSFYTLSLHDALPISIVVANSAHPHSTLYFSTAYCLLSTVCPVVIDDFNDRGERYFHDLSIGAFHFDAGCRQRLSCLDRKSTRLNSSHVAISYAVFCL